MTIKYAILKTSNFEAMLKKTAHFSSITEQPWFPILLEPKGKVVLLASL
jgi:hypothetical protein